MSFEVLEAFMALDVIVSIVRGYSRNGTRVHLKGVSQRLCNITACDAVSNESSSLMRHIAQFIEYFI